MSIAIPTSDQPLSVPVDALSSAGFRRWAASGEFPRHVKITPCDDGLMIEGAVADVPRLEFAFRLPQAACTPAGFSAWATSDQFPERGRVSFLQHEIAVDMSPEELNTHSFLKLRISFVIDAFVSEQRLGKFYPDGTLLRNDEIGLSTVPDGLFASVETLNSGRLHFTKRDGHENQYTELVGTPDWVLEVVSRSSVRKDKHLLRDLYHRAGIAEYWLVDALGEDIAFQILVHQPDGYAAAPINDGWIRSPVFGRAFRLHRRHDEWGHWEYTLDMAE
jgi:Uma2 family endonuclease